jgi:hypothetical protein
MKPKRFKPLFVVSEIIAVFTMLASLNLFNVSYSVRRPSVILGVIAGPTQGVAEHPYTYFVDMMSKDFLSRLSGILPQDEVIQAYERACPQEVFVENTQPVVADVIALLTGKVVDITSPLDIRCLRQGITAYYLEASKKDPAPEHQELLAHLSEVVSQFPDTLNSDFIMPRSDVLRLEGLQRLLAMALQGAIVFGAVCLAACLVLAFSGTLPRALTIAGALGLFGSAVAAVALAVTKPAAFIPAVIAAEAKSSAMLMALESAVIFIIGALFLWRARRRETP